MCQDEVYAAQKRRKNDSARNSPNIFATYFQDQAILKLFVFARAKDCCAVTTSGKNH